MRPRIAIPADTLTEATNVINERNAPYAPRPAIEAIVKSGGVPVILPSVDPKFVDDYIDLFDGIVFAGGLMSIRPFWRRTSFEAEDDLPQT